MALAYKLVYVRNEQICVLFCQRRHGPKSWENKNFGGRERSVKVFASFLTSPLVTDGRAIGIFALCGMPPKNRRPIGRQ